MDKTCKSAVTDPFRIFDIMLEGVTVYKLIFNDNHQVIDGILEYMNPATVETMNIKPEDAIGKSAVEVFGLDFIKPHLKAIHELHSTGQRNPFEVYYAPTDKYFLVSGFDMQDNLFAVLRTDITEEKKAEESLRESRELYKAIFENSQDAVFLTIPDGSILDANPAAEKMFGYSKEKMCKLGRDGLVDISDPRLPRILEERKQKGKFKAELKHIRNDGSKFEGEMSSRLFKDRHGNERTVLTIRDITERKKAEEEVLQARKNLEEQVQERTSELGGAYETIKESEVKFRELFNKALDMIVLSEARENGLLGNFIEVNDAAVNILGYTREEFLNKTPLDLFAPDNQEEVPKIMGELLKRGYTTFQSISITKDERRIPVEVSVHIFRLGEKKVGLAIARDITERKKAEEGIKRNNKTSNGITQIFREALTVGTEEKLGKTCLTVCEEVTDSEFGFICEVNDDGTLDTIAISDPGWSECKMPQSDAVKMLRGIKIHGLYGGAIKLEGPVLTNDPSTYHHSVGTPPGHPPIRAYLGFPLKFGDKIIGVIGLANKKGGYTIEDQESVRILSIAVVEAIMSFRSRNEVKEYRDQLEGTVKELERSNYELQSFAYITSHDLQEPLRTIASFAQLIERRYKGKLDPDADEFIEFMVDGASRMKEMIQGLLEYSRVGTRGGEFTEFESEVALNYALNNLGSAIDEVNAEITSDPLPVIFADKDQIIRVFQNLIGNAIKFRKEGVQPKIHVSSKTEDNKYVFSVSDNGIGLEEEYNDKIFEVFKRLHSIGEYQGAGIGLAVVKRIIDRHGGRIWVESELDKGSTFYFTIPIK
jgi:PAS domain S-box-containing protein